MNDVVKEDQIARFMDNGNDFINENEIERFLREKRNVDQRYVRDIVQKSLSIERLEPEETAALLNVEDKDLWQEMFLAAGDVKRRVYDNRIVTFAPLYISNYCVNSCLYCAFRKENTTEKRRRLTLDEVRKETEALVSTGHKRLIVVYGEHTLSDVHYITDTIKTIYDVEVGNGRIRRVNVNASPMSIEDLKLLKQAGI